MFYFFFNSWLLFSQYAHKKIFCYKVDLKIEVDPVDGEIYSSINVLSEEDQNLYKKPECCFDIQPKSIVIPARKSAKCNIIYNAEVTITTSL